MMTANPRSLIKKLGAICGFLLLTACTTSGKDTTSEDLGARATDAVQRGTEAVTTQIYDVFDKNSAVLDFSEGSASLSDVQRTNLRATVGAVRDDGTIKRVVLASWSDQDFPVSPGDRLPTSARNLAKSRADNVKASLAGLGLTDVIAYNMAEYPGWLQRTVNTDEAQVKGAASTRSGDEDAELGRVIRDKGGPSKVVVIIEPALSVQ